MDKCKHRTQAGTAANKISIPEIWPHPTRSAFSCFFPQSGAVQFHNYLSSKAGVPSTLVQYLKGGGTPDQPTAPLDRLVKHSFTVLFNQVLQ